MLIPSVLAVLDRLVSSLSRRVNANSQPSVVAVTGDTKLIKKGEC